MTVEIKMLRYYVSDNFNCCMIAMTIETKIFRDHIKEKFKCCEIDHVNRNKDIQRLY